jgi:hypothetical protein
MHASPPQRESRCLHSLIHTNSITLFTRRDRAIWSVMAETRLNATALCTSSSLPHAKEQSGKWGDEETWKLDNQVHDHYFHAWIWAEAQAQLCRSRT